MICLKNRTFAVSQTASSSRKNRTKLLWFAWKIVLLQYHKQLTIIIYLFPSRCDLLEKSYFCSITNSTYLRTIIRIQLWFAWKIVLLQYHKQLILMMFIPCSRCDLLEKSYFCSITNSNRQHLIEGKRVVICLKNRTFAVSQTANARIVEIVD